MAYNNYKYVIINTSEVSNIDFSKVKENESYLRYNNDKDKTFVKFEGETPDFLNGKTQYNHSDILSILRDKTGEWYYTEEFED